jgi:pimeloyl-ACP methyl ester carboxylesterase
MAGCIMTRRIAGPAGALAVDDGGVGEIPVVLVHSLAGNSAHWSRQLEHLRPARRAVAIDLRGHGRSEPPRTGDYSINGMAGDVEAVVDALKLQRVVLVGHSMGGGVALAYAGHHPEGVAGLLLLDPIGDESQTPAQDVASFLEGLETSDDSIIQYWSQIAGPDESVKERLLSDLLATPRPTVVKGFREVMRFDPKPSLTRYQGPVLSIITPYNVQPSSLHRLGRGFPHRMIEGTGHWIQLDKPDLINQLLDEFLRNVSGKSEKRER